MGIKVYKPTSAGRRNMSVNDFAELTRGNKPERSLVDGGIGKSGADRLKNQLPKTKIQTNYDY